MKPGLRFKLTAWMFIIVFLPLFLVPFTAFGISSADSSGQETDLAVLTGIILVVIPLIGCTIMMTMKIKRNILNPLKELTHAAENMMKGKLEVPITYGSNDEMGQFSAVFEMMRVRLLESANKQAEYEQARKELIASISHDLRTPLTSIKGYVEGLQDGVAQDRAKFEKYLSIILSKTEKLDGLIEDLFLFSQLESGQMRMERDIRRCSDLLEAIVGPLELEPSEGSERLTVQRPFPDGYVRVDEARLAQVFDNMVGNALKYAGADAHIHIAASVTDGQLEVTIGDDGPAIADRHLSRLFDRFYRVEPSRSGNTGGAGLGLAICKHIVERHEGEIGVRPRSGGGNEFFFRLDLVQL